MYIHMCKWKKLQMFVLRHSTQLCCFSLFLLFKIARYLHTKNARMLQMVLYSYIYVCTSIFVCRTWFGRYSYVIWMFLKLQKCFVVRQSRRKWQFTVFSPTFWNFNTHISISIEIFPHSNTMLYYLLEYWVWLGLRENYARMEINRKPLILICISRYPAVQVPTSSLMANLSI